MIIEFLTNNLWNIIVGFLIFIFILVLIDNRNSVIKKIKTESISFLAMVFSVSMALISYISKPDAMQQGTLSLFEGGIVSWAFPITAFFIILAIITSIIFFSKSKRGKK